MTSLYQSVGVVDIFEWAHVLCGHRIQNDWASRAMNLHQILCEAWTFLCGNYSDNSEGHSYGQLMIGKFITTMLPLMHHVSYRVLGETSSPTWLNTQYSPDLVPCDFWPFLKLKSPMKGKRCKTISEIQENTMGQLMVTGRELCEVPRCLLWRGLRCHCPVYNVSCIFFNNCLYWR